MKNSIILQVFVLLCLSTISIFSADKRCFNWIIDGGGGITFNTQNLEPVKFTAPTWFLDNCPATLSDSEGNLLLYSDGINYIHNKYNKSINDSLFFNYWFPPNWDQNVILIPKPGNDSLIYLFLAGSPDPGISFRYTLVNTKLNKDSGSIVEKQVKANINPVYKKIAATYNSDGKSIWVVIHEWNSNFFKSYLIDENGIQKPIISAVGPIMITEPIDDQSYMKIAPDGKKIAMIHLDINGYTTLQLYDFDNNTGKISKPIILNIGSSNPGFLEFSSSGNKLYTLEGYYQKKFYNSHTRITQWDVNVTDSAGLRKSMTTLNRADSTEQFIGLQLAPNNKIYYLNFDWRDGNSGTDILGEIQNSNGEGRNAVCKDSTVQLNNRTDILNQNFISTFMWDSCGHQSFEYPFFKFTDGLTLNGSATQLGDNIRLTDTSSFASASVWYNRQVPVNNSFESSFSFRMSHGNNFGTDDKSYPGADGIALVIQNSSITSIGKSGGDMGYGEIPNSIAIEFDLFKNDSYNDPSGNHVAIQTDGKNANSPIHNSIYTIKIADLPFIVRSDSTPLFAKIKYFADKMRIEVYLDTVASNETLVLFADNFKIDSILSLKDNQYAFLGLSSATGNATQNHDLINWKFCSKEYQDKNITSVDYTSNPKNHDFILINPQPADNYCNIKLPGTISNLVISDLLGSDLMCQLNYIINENDYTLNINTTSMPNGIYFISFLSNNKTYSTKFIILH